MNYLCPALGLITAFAIQTPAGFAESNHAPEPGMLFYLSGESGTTADFSAGKTPVPNFDSEITKISDGPKGAALSCGNTQRLSYWAPGNIYAQRGTLSFFWRSRDEVGPTEFPVFRVGYADHSSWDMVFLRIDYNGHGFDAFVTDANLARTRVSVTLDPFPKANEWIHISLSWDETKGIRFYVNGKLAAHVDTQAVYNAALDQFGPHSRIISPHNVQSDYNYVRGGDIDEVKIFDRMLSDDNIATLSKTESVTSIPDLPARDLADSQWRQEWWLRYGWNRPNDIPEYLKSATTSVRKVEIHDAYDLKRWWWKANDGIRETTWPGVFNRSRLPGRNDYFQLPDWDCYSLSGKSITFTMPEEPWNHLEISGAAYGKMKLLGAKSTAPSAEPILFERAKGQEKTIHSFLKPITGQKIRFDNLEQEVPIEELSAYYVSSGREPPGTSKLAFKLGRIGTSPDESLAALTEFIDGRFTQDERATLVARPAGGRVDPTSTGANSQRSLPLVHILIPNASGDPAYKLDQVNGGLDGIAIDLPALKVKPTHGEFFPLNIEVKDPIWPLRDMFDFTFSVKPGEARTLWLDLRDRILPEGKGLYLTIAGAGSDFGAQSLEGAEIRLVFKSKESAKAEHEIDRFTQLKDSYAMLVEEHPFSPKLKLWTRFETDLNDLLRVNPNHYPGLNYKAVAIPGSVKIPYKQPEAPQGTPLWAFRQVEALKRVKHFVNWWIDNRQIENGEFGGGLSDDVDLTNTWPGVAFMGCTPDKISHSLQIELDAMYRQGQFTRGLPTIQADELHSYEEGINCLGQNMILNFGSPRQIERAMETQRGVESLTGTNAAGHRHIRTSYYSGTKMAEDGVWGYAKAYSYLVLQPGQLLVEYNGNPAAKKVLVELADGLLAHRHKNEQGEYTLPSAIHFSDDQDSSSTRPYLPWPLFWTAWKWTGEKKYLAPVFDGGAFAITALNANAIDILDLRKEGTQLLSNQRTHPVDGRAIDPNRGGNRTRESRSSAFGHFYWQLDGDKSHLEKLYADQIEAMDIADYINTEGSLWIDRVSVPYTELQRARLGGIALVRNGTFPGHTVSWKFSEPANDESVAILIPNATQTQFKVIAYNLQNAPVKAQMTGWNIDPGIWEMTQGIDSKGADQADQASASTEIALERSKAIDITFAPHATTVLNFKLKTPGTPYWQRPDLGIDPEDVSVHGREIRVTIHSIGGIASPATNVVLRNAGGEIIGLEKLASLPAPVDLLPKSSEIQFALPDGVSASGCSIEIDPDNKLEEITKLNNRVCL